MEKLLKRPLAPSSKESRPCPQFAHALDTLSNVAAILTTGLLFLTVLLVAAGLGYALHVGEEHFHWMADWMFSVGHAVEALLYVADLAGLLWSVGKHLHHQFTGRH